MVDRYEDGVRKIQEQPVPDLWDEIQGRAAGQAGSGDTEGDVVSLDEERGGRRRRWPTLAAAAAACAAVVIGAAVLIDDSDPEVTTEPTGPPASTAPPPTSPSTTTEPPTTSLPDEAEAPADGAVTSCADLELSSSGAPEDLDRTQQSPTPDDPRLLEAARPNLVGVFDSTRTTQRAVFVIDTRGFGEDGGRYLQHPELGEVWLVHGGDQGIAEPSISVGDESCEITLWSIGLTEPELEQFILGLSAKPLGS